MAKAVSFLYLVVLSIWCLQDVSALNCYKCSSLAGMNQPCEVDPTIRESDACAEGQTQCVIITMGGLYRPPILSRHCGSAGYCDTMSLGSTVFNKVETCQSCDTDLCNSA